MDIPSALRAALETVTAERAMKDLRDASKTISERYREQRGTGKPLATEAGEALAYAVARMPATYGAVSAALQYALCSAKDCRSKTLLDAGAGTGAASWSAATVAGCESIVCLEREPAMRDLGEKLMAYGPEPLQNARWVSQDLSAEPIRERADLVIASYVLNEMREESRQRVLNALWNAAEQMLLIVEPGTPEGFRQIRSAKATLLARGAHIAAPCPEKGLCADNVRSEEDVCPIREGDWCHFTCRIARSRLHKALKSGDAPYEDEKFCYMAFTRSACEPAELRVLRHPYVEKSRVTLYACDGMNVTNRVITRKDAEAFRAARKASSGDALDFEKRT